jgi:asparagine synthase (glutamine-hydrolysing)
MFAFAIHDVDRRLVHLVRDRVGIKPLYYARVGGGFSWASELKALESFHGRESLAVDRTALYDFLTYKYVPAPKSLYENVFKLEPAHYLTLSLDGMHVRKDRYWELRAEPVAVSLEDASAEVRRLLSASVSEQLVSDVPLGSFLSGGIDSTTIVAEASKARPGINTYAIGFDDAGHDETHFAAVAARRFGTSHHTKRLDAAGARELFGSLRAWYDEPFADTSAFPTFLVSEYARQKSVVALSGDGGDEVFGGYNWYSAYREHPAVPGLVTRSARPIASYLKRRFPRRHIRNAAIKAESRLLLGGLEHYTRLMGGLLREEKENYREAWGIPDDYDDYWFFRSFYREELPRLTRLQYMDLHTFLPEDVLTKVDRVSMAVSLEVRVPLLATPLVEFAFSTPEEVRFPGGRLKGLLKHAYAGVVPDEILNRPKKGFSIPLHAWSPQLLDGARNRQDRILRTHFGEEAGLPVAA